MLRIYIPARSTSVSRVVFNQATSKFSTLEYSSVVGAEVKASTRINALAGVVHTMEQLSEKSLTGVNIIYTVGMVADAISKGTFKYWLETKKTSDDVAVNETELELWARFADVYKELYLNVVIKNISTATLPKSTKFGISNEQRIDDKYAKMAWDKLPAVGQAEEVEGDAF